ncbi:MAG: lytic transglycosylase domain-containing protein [Actinomycetota bacterium]
MRLSGRIGLGAPLGRGVPQSAWGRLAAGAAAAFFLILMVASMGATTSSLAGGPCAPSEAAVGSVRSVPQQYARHYIGAAERFRLGQRAPAILAAIHKLESDFGRPTLPGVFSGENSAGAGGPMQFLLSTWRRYGVDGDRDGDRDRYNAADAIYGAANYLRASGGPGDWYGAIFAYNHADWYVNDVLAAARRFGDLGDLADATCAPSAAGVANLRKAVRLYEPRAFRRLPAKLMAPGYAPQALDARIWPDAVWILRSYGLRVTAARESGHATHGDGTALDLVPAGDLRSQAAWDRSAGRLARDLGWRRGCGRSGSRPACDLVPGIQFVGYDGYPSHGSPRTCGGGCPAHIHVSWVSSTFGSGPLAPPPAWVLVFPAPGAGS